MAQLKLVGLLACFVAGALLAGLLVANGVAADTTTTGAITETTTIVESTTAPATTVVTTFEHTTTQRVLVHPATTAETTTSSSSAGSTPAWVWALVGILAVALVALIVLLARRGGGVSSQERRRRLDMAVGTWAAQGWALESQSGDSAVLQREGERMVVTIAPSGQVGTQLLT